MNQITLTHRHQATLRRMGSDNPNEASMARRAFSRWVDAVMATWPTYSDYYQTRGAATVSPGVGDQDTQ